ncbi:MAG: hypothetical protein HQL95_02175 [Magnetococcales bacterium]|nr:hypothetical protein [Magnetococcales bacterium]
MGCPDIPNVLIVPRLFSRMEASGGEQNHPSPLSDFFDEKALVILGEPGMGKSTSFLQAAKKEANSEYLTIRQFIPPRNPTDLAGKTLYLDGLDEQRAGRANVNDVLDAIIGCLQELGYPKFRISCRTADWLGGLDKSSLSDAVKSGGITVLRMDPLNEGQIQDIVVARGLDGAAFLDQARQSGIEEWITNPQHLELVLNVVSKGQTWPETRKELFERACLELVQEHNEIHRRAKTNFPADQLICASGLLCAIILRADLEGVAIEQTNADEGFPALSRFSESSLPLVEAARTKLFRHPFPERATYLHRTMAEYLAACFLVHQMINGLPAERVRCLLTTDNGLVPSPLRGVHAWVATLCPEPIHSLFLWTDPMGLVLFGDPASLSPSRKGDLLDAIAELAKQNPWFRGGHWESHPLGRLADAKLKNRFEAILADWHNQPNHMLHTVLDIALSGETLPVSQEALMAFIYENDAPSNLRAQAAEAFVSHCPKSIHDLKAVLCDLDRHPSPDDDHGLRAVLLRALYPSHLTPEKLIDFLPPPKPQLIGTYYMFLSHDLVELTPDDQLPSLLAVLIQNKHRPDRQYEGHLAWQSLMSEALVRVLELHGERVAPETLYAWLDVGTDEHGFSVLLQGSDDSHASRVREWMNFHPDIIKELFLLWIQRIAIHELEEKHFNFWERLQNLPIPAWFPDWCLELATKTLDKDVSNALFRIAIHYLLHQPPKPPYPLDRAFTFVEQYPCFGTIPDCFLYYELRDYDWKRIRNQDQMETKKNQEKSNLRVDLSNRIEGIQAGIDLNALFYLGEIYQGFFNHANRDLHPRKRLRKETSAEIAQAAEAGFVQYLTKQSIPTPQEIGDLSVKNKCSYIGCVVLAAMDLSSTHAEQNTLKIQDSVLSSAIAFQLALLNGREYPAWFQTIVLSRPDLVAEACQAFWLPQLRAGKEHVSGLYALAREELWSEVAKKVVLPLLKECPHLDGQNLRELLIAALRWGDHQELLSLSQVILNSHNDHGAGWYQWAGTAFLLDQAIWSNLLPVLEQNREDAFNFMMFIGKIVHGDDFNRREIVENIDLSVHAIKQLIDFFGQQWNVTDSNIIVDHQITTESKMAGRIHALINHLAGKTSPEAACELQLLANNDKLQPWRNSLLHALSKHRQMMADNNFQSMTWDAVFNVLKGDTPGTVRDLHAFVLDQMCTIAKELRDSKTNGYKAYWNTNGHNKTTEPKSENNSRDRLLEALQHKLTHLPDIHAEPEGRYADDNRADIKVLFKSWNVPVEIKQDYHPNLWNAAQSQLIAQYVRDPGTEGYGIYLVFWYGTHGKGLTNPPQESGFPAPTTWEELESALQKTIPAIHATFVQVIVLDVSTHQPKP